MTDMKSLTDLLEERSITRSDFYGVYFILPTGGLLAGVSSLDAWPHSPVIAAICFLYPVLIWGMVLVAFLRFSLSPHLFGPPAGETRKFLVELLSEGQDDG